MPVNKPQKTLRNPRPAGFDARGVEILPAPTMALRRGAPLQRQSARKVILAISIHPDADNLVRQEAMRTGESMGAVVSRAITLLLGDKK